MMELWDLENERDVKEVERGRFFSVKSCKTPVELL
jgi:hypothetical protein